MPKEWEHEDTEDRVVDYGPKPLWLISISLPVKKKVCPLFFRATSLMFLHNDRHRGAWVMYGIYDKAEVCHSDRTTLYYHRTQKDFLKIASLFS